MSATDAFFVSSELITRESYIEFFEGLSCHWYSGHKKEAIILDEHTQVGVCLMDSDYSETFDATDLKEFEIALGGQPKTYFEVNRTKSEDPNHLYMVVVRIMAKKWPIAVFDINEKIVSYRDLIE